MEKKKSVNGHMNESPLDQAVEVLDNVKEKGTEYWEKGKSIWDSVESNSRKTLRQTRSFVEKNPIQSLGYAALAGAVLALIFFPKRQS